MQLLLIYDAGRFLTEYGHQEDAEHFWGGGGEAGGDFVGAPVVQAEVGNSEG